MVSRLVHKKYWFIELLTDYLIIVLCNGICKQIGIRPGEISGLFTENVFDGSPPSKRQNDRLKIGLNRVEIGQALSQTDN